jgi:hypothetical protein
MNAWHIVWRQYSAEGEGRMRYLLIALVVLLLIHPYLGDGGQFSPALRIFGVVVPVAGLLAISRSRRLALVALALALPVLLSTSGGLAGLEVFPPPVEVICSLAFYLFTTLVILRYVVIGRHVEADTIYGALSVYLMLGLTWTMAYVLTQYLAPGSFTVAGAAEGVNLSGRDLLYFSYVTLTTLGYGDITPVSAPARALVVLEALTGVLYLAVLIARLIAIYQPDPSPNS